MTRQRSRAPEFPEHAEWFNADKPVRLQEQRGRVVILEFSCYCSIQCQHVLADLRQMEHKYRDNLTVIGIHAPKFPHEKSREHVGNAIHRNHIRHPVINDPELGLYHTYGIGSRPTLVVIDTQGGIVGSLSGEGKRDRLDRIIRTLLEQQQATPAAPCPAIACTQVQIDKVAHALSFPGRILATGSRVYIADSGHNRILATSPQGHVLQQYGSDSPGFFDGDGTMTAFDNPQGMLLVDEFLYVADTGNHAIRRIHIRHDDVVTVAGTGSIGIRPEEDYFSSPLEVDLNSPCGLAVRDNVMYIAMSGLHQIWALSLTTNTLEVIAGNGEEGLVDGRARQAAFAQPTALTILGHLLYVVDAGSSAIRVINLNTREVSTLVGRGLRDCGDHDGPIPIAKFQYPLDILADPGRDALWIADTYNNKIRKLDIINNLVSSVSVNHALDEPGGLAFSGDSLYIANTNLHEIVRLNLHSGNTEALNVNDDYTRI